VSEEGLRRVRFSWLVNRHWFEEKHDRPKLNYASIKEDKGIGIGGTYLLTLGVCGGFYLGRAFLGFGAGYEGFALAYSSIDASPFSVSVLIRHGFAIKSFLSF